MKPTVNPPFNSISELILSADGILECSEHLSLTANARVRVFDPKFLGVSIRQEILARMLPDDWHFHHSLGLCIALDALARVLLDHPEANALRRQSKQVTTRLGYPHRYSDGSAPVNELLRLQRVAFQEPKSEQGKERSEEVVEDLTDVISTRSKVPTLEELRDSAIATIAHGGDSSFRHPLVTEHTLRRISFLKRDEQQKRREGWMQKLFEKPVRDLPAANANQLRRLDALAHSFPNFTSVVSVINNQIRLRAAGSASASISPLLLVGPPGVGKTAFLEQLAHCIDHEDVRFNIAGSSASWVLKGGSPSWSNSGPGEVFKAAVGLGTGKGLLITLDEVDKAANLGRQYPVEPVLLELLEPNQLRRFSDEFMEMELNLLGLCSLVATANTLSSISSPVLSRLQIIEVTAPSPAQMPVVVKSVDASLRRQHAYLNRIFRPLSEAVIERLSTQTPRELQRFLFNLYCTHAPTTLKGVREITVMDVARSASKRRRA